MMEIEGSIPFVTEWGNLIGGGASVIGLFVAIYTLYKVHSIDSATKEERQRLSSALDLGRIHGQIQEAIEILRDENLDADKVKDSMLTLSGELRTALRIVLPEDFSVNDMIDVKLRRDGYWTDEFGIEMLQKVKSELTIVSWRNTRSFNENHLSHYEEALRENTFVRFKIFYISPECDPEVFQHMDRMLDVGDAASMRSQNENSKTIALNYLSKNLRSETHYNYNDRFKIYEFSIPPSLHCIICDDTVYWGINFFMDKSLGSSSLLDKAYIEAPIDSKFGTKVREQIQILEKLSKKVDIPNVPTKT